MVLKLNETYQVLPESYLHNSYEKYDSITDEEVWDSGNCRVSDICKAKLPNENSYHWIMNGDMARFCGAFRDVIERGELKSNLLFRDGHLQLNVEQIKNKRKCDSWYDQDRMMEQLAN